MSKKHKKSPQSRKIATKNFVSTSLEHTFLQAFSLHQDGHFVHAAALYEQILKVQPHHFEALHLLGVIAFQTKTPHRAIELLDRAIEINPNHPVVYFNRGNVLNALGQFEAARLNYTQAINIYPEYADAYHNRGFVLKELKQYGEALRDFDKAIEIQPNDSSAHFNRGYVLESLQQFEAAVTSYDQAIVLNPGFAEAYVNRGNALQRIMQFSSAIQSYSHAIDLKPDYADAYFNRGTILTRLNQHAAAIQDHKQAILYQSDNVEAYNNLGNALQEFGLYDEALKNYEYAILLDPGYAAAQHNIGLWHLLRGSFEQGWEKYEWRRKVKKLDLHEQNYTQPQWDGSESLQGKTILLHSEQGFGDTLQFCRYAKLVADLGATVLFEVEKVLIGLFDQLAGVTQLIIKGYPLPGYDYHCPLLSLPRAFNTDLTNIPASRNYLTSDAVKLQKWEIKLGQKTKPRIGLVWSGSAGHTNDHNRSIPLDDFASVLVSQFQFISLQKELRYTDIELVKSREDILFFGDELLDFTDTAALIETVDLVISADTSVAHLAGALGKQVWILLPFEPDWRWMLNRDDSPWYPSAKLYRQTKIGDWAGVIQKVKYDLLQQFG